MYLATLVCPISRATLGSSPCIRGAPHSGLAILISRISLRISCRTVGRPAPRRDFQLQNDLNPARCHFMTVSGFTIARALRTVGAKRYNPTKIKRSAVLKVCLFGEFRRSTLIWCRRSRVSAANEARDRNNPTNAVQIRLQASLIRAKDCVILPQLSAPLGLRQGQARIGLIPPSQQKTGGAASQDRAGTSAVANSVITCYPCKDCCSEPTTEAAMSDDPDFPKANHAFPHGVAQNEIRPASSMSNTNSYESRPDATEPAFQVGQS